MDEYPIIDLSHLLPAVQGLARLPADERIQRLRADRWIGYPRAVEALNRLETLYAWPNKQRMPNLLLIGPTNNGKSMIVEKFRRTHPASSDADQEHIPVLVVQMPSEPSVIRFYVALLAAMGAPLRPRPRLPEMEQLALALLRKVGVRMLVIDELHNVLAGNSVNRREFLNLLRFLGNELRIPLVGVGTRDAYLAIRSDDQLENRFEPMMLPLWEANDDPAVGFDNWRKAIEGLDLEVPILIENTAGGANAMARHLDRIAMLWDAVASAKGAENVGFCLDTCHAHASGMDPAGLVDAIRSITGRIDLVHLNDSRDAAGSGADRHEVLGLGQVDPEFLVEVVREADTATILETPGDAASHAAQVDWLRALM